MVNSFISACDKKDKNKVEKDRIFFIIKSYITIKLVGLGRLELPTSPLSGVRSKPTELQTHLRGGRILQ